MPANQPEQDETLLAADREPPPPGPAGVIARGTSLGRYVVLDRLGEGGMGVVYAAYDPELDRKVAVKLLQVTPGVASKATGGRARLLREAQAMARLVHPNVISVFDVGTIEDSVFVAMEFVQGRTLKRWVADARKRGASWRELLEPFLAAGKGLIAAHGANIVHRDFKPDNVMVADGQAEASIESRVRVLDFGLAAPAGATAEDGDEPVAEGEPAMGYRAKRLDRFAGTAPESHSQTGAGSGFALRLTATGAIMGTPAYMAPEQHLGKASDARTDQFAFCVAVFEALYGRRPFTGTSVAELASNVLQAELVLPPKGSRVPARIHRALLRGLSTDPEKRHPSMEALLGDLTRDPARRRRQILAASLLVGVGGAASAAAVALGPDRSLCEGAEASLHGVWDDEVRDDVRAAFSDESKAYADAALPLVEKRLDEYATQWVAMHTEACEASRVRGEQSDEVLTLRMACLDERLDRLRTLTAMLTEADYGVVQTSMEAAHGLPAIDACADVQTLRLGVAPPEDPDTARRVAELRSDIDRVKLLANSGKLPEARALAESTLASLRSLAYRPAVAEALTALGSTHLRADRFSEAQEALDEASYLADATGHDEKIVDVAIALMTLEAWSKNRWDVALAHGRRAEAVLERVGAWPKFRVRLLTQRAQVHARIGENDKAATELEEALEILEELDAHQSPGALPTLNQLGARYVELGRHDEARATLDAALEIAKEELGGLHPEVGATQNGIARLLAVQGDNEGALVHLRQALHVFEASLGPDHGNVVAVLNGIGLIQHELERFDEARQSFERGLEILERTDGDRINRAYLLNNLGSLHTDAKNYRLAVDTLQRSIEEKTRLYGPDHEEVAYGLDNLGRALREAGRHDQAVQAYRRAVEILQAVYGPDHHQVAYSITGIGEALLLAGRPDDALTELTEAVRIYERSPDADYDSAAEARFALAKAAAAADDADAVAEARRALLMLLARPDHSIDDRVEIEEWLAARAPDPG